MNDHLKQAVKYAGDPWADASRSYYRDCEAYTGKHWKNIILPFMGKRYDFGVTIDLACGHGRHSEMMMEFDSVTELILMDIQQSNIEICKKRLAKSKKKTTFLVGNGFDFRPLESDSIQTIFCYDAAVHFDSDVIRSYLRDAKRILVPGGGVFLHHSNYDGHPGGETLNGRPSWRNFMTLPLIAHYAAKEGLHVLRQEPLSWDKIEDLDGLSLFQKPISL